MAWLAAARRGLVLPMRCGNEAVVGAARPGSGPHGWPAAAASRKQGTGAARGAYMQRATSNCKWDGAVTSPTSESEPYKSSTNINQILDYI